MRFIETSVFTKQVTLLLSDEEYHQLQIELSVNPKSGNVIRGTGGLRKVRWSKSGTGKRGGVRTIYFYLDRKDIIFMLLVYGKNQKENLTEKEKKILAQMAKGFEE